ncbi:MAG TPA: DUF554 domain-containing protein [Verrucomicrobiae bacterium]|nr:DUF554 domain-containing protein [Verrucomicrobiae bacterium]
MTGTLINTGAVLLGSAAGLAFSDSLRPHIEVRLRRLLGVLVIYVGFSTTVKSLGKTGLSHVPKELAIVFLALILGNALGMLLHLQDGMNKIGQYAKRLLTKAQDEPENRFSEGLVTATLLFCVGPMAIVGAIEDGISGNYKTLALKSVMDGLASFAFVKTFGPGVIFSAIPVLAYQGTITLAARAIKPFLDDHPELLYSISATGGLLVVCISVVILEIRRVPLANYLPALIVAPLLAWWWGF